MDFDQGLQAPGSPESRSGAFDTGLAEASARQNSMVPRTFTQHSVLQQPWPSGNGMASKDYERMIPGLNVGGRPFIMPSLNGIAQDTYDQSMTMRLRKAS